MKMSFEELKKVNNKNFKSNLKELGLKQRNIKVFSYTKNSKDGKNFYFGLHYVRGHWNRVSLNFNILIPMKTNKEKFLGEILLENETVDFSKFKKAFELLKKVQSDHLKELKLVKKGFLYSEETVNTIVENSKDSEKIQKIIFGEIKYPNLTFTTKRIPNFYKNFTKANAEKYKETLYLVAKKDKHSTAIRLNNIFEDEIETLNFSLESKSLITRKDSDLYGFKDYIDKFYLEDKESKNEFIWAPYGKLIPDFINECDFINDIKENQAAKTILENLNKEISNKNNLDEVLKNFTIKNNNIMISLNEVFDDKIIEAIGNMKNENKIRKN